MVIMAVSWLHEPSQVTENNLLLPVSATGIVVFHADLEINCAMQTQVKLYLFNIFGYLQLGNLESCSSFLPPMYQYMLLHHSVLVDQHFSYVAGFLHHRLLSMLPMIPNWPRYSLLKEIQD